MRLHATAPPSGAGSRSALTATAAGRARRHLDGDPGRAGTADTRHARGPIATHPPGRRRTKVHDPASILDRPPSRIGAPGSRSMCRAPSGPYSQVPHRCFPIVHEVSSLMSVRRIALVASLVAVSLSLAASPMLAASAGRRVPRERACDRRIAGRLRRGLALGLGAGLLGFVAYLGRHPHPTHRRPQSGTAAAGTTAASSSRPAAAPATLAVTLTRTELSLADLAGGSTDPGPDPLRSEPASSPSTPRPSASRTTVGSATAS